MTSPDNHLGATTLMRAFADYHQRAHSLPDDGKPGLQGMQLALDNIARVNPKARNLTCNS